MKTVGVLGSGTMGSGIAQVAATYGHSVILHDKNVEALEKAQSQLNKILSRLVEKGKINEAKKDDILANIVFSEDFNELHQCDIIIEAIIENLEIKKSVFKALEDITKPTTILASNTSSLSIASIAAACEHANRVIGIHFFNPAPLMPLVEIIPAIQTDKNIMQEAKALIDSWDKITVLAKDTPGFIVNRVARPFYGEAIRILEEGIADVATIDWAMKEIGRFRMGPFTLMDFIGNDVNYKVTETVFKEFFYDPRYKPSFTQKRLYEAGYLGRKTGKGYYDYNENAINPEPNKDEKLGNEIVNRIVAMLINEAADALYLNIASKEDIDLAMTKGVNYPKGLLKWCDELGAKNVLQTLDNLYDIYREDRYRASVLLRKMAEENSTFY
ncbi:MAG TPA: 3-hydroxybutyryl-CoA dehydrogenase [Flavobacteriales bacterium]|nr:3-hydroxybutyryl-CoA dehydrogenase [Flavobacteriales bacterium]|tara:strand:- start:100637 stop:101794 length:1158 start_codon:yes stop_codon:yes gene_type:complete